MDGNGFDDLTRRLATGRSRRSVLKGLIGGGAAVLATGAGSTLAKPSPDKKVTVCHYDASTGQYYEISIAKKALDKHLQNNPGDTLGACAACTPVDCQYGEWSGWSECTVPCGGGTQISDREVTVPADCGGACSEPLEQQQACNIQACCVSEVIDCTGKCGLTNDNCGLNPVNCTLGCPCEKIPEAVACNGHCSTQQSDGCNGFWNCPVCPCVPDACAADACGDRFDSCGNIVGHCADDCTCRPTFEWCIPGVTTCCGTDGCDTWTDCNSYDNGYCC